MSYLYQPPVSIHLEVPHIPQSAQSDCLVACVSMVLGYKKHPIFRWRLARTLKSKKHGTHFPNLDHLAQLNIHVFRQEGTLESLYNALKNNHPCIAAVQTGELPHWKGYRSDHAVVVIGMDKEIVYLNDPAFPIGDLRIPIGDFDLAWFEGRERYAVLVP